MRHKEELDKWVTSWTLQHDPYDVMNMVQGAGVCAAVVQDVEDQFKRDVQYAATGFLVNMTEPEAGDVVTENVPMRFSETPGQGARAGADDGRAHARDRSRASWPQR